MIQVHISWLQPQKKVIGEPLKANRLYWAFALCLLPFGLMLVGGERALEVLKTASLLASVPLLAIFVMMMISFLRTLSEDRLKLEDRAENIGSRKTFVTYNTSKRTERNDIVMQAHHYLILR